MSAAEDAESELSSGRAYLALSYLLGRRGSDLEVAARQVSGAGTQRALAQLVSRLQAPDRRARALTLSEELRRLALELRARDLRVRGTGPVIERRGSSGDRA